MNSVKHSWKRILFKIFQLNVCIQNSYIQKPDMTDILYPLQKHQER